MGVFLDTLRKMKMGDDLDWIAPDGRRIKLSEFGEGDNVFWTSDMQDPLLVEGSSRSEG